MARISTATIALSMLCLSSPPAFANGRFPSADQLLIDPADARHWILRATFGLLQSHDAGQSFSWICEDAVGYAQDRDPALAIVANGTVLAGFSRELRASRDDACAWVSPFPEAAQESLLDATADPADENDAFFLSHSLSSSHEVRIFSARDDGSPLAPLDLALGDDFSPVTVEVAPSAPNRLYVTGILNDLSTVLLRSDDRGQSWVRHEISPHSSAPAYIAAVDPSDPDRLYLRLDDDTTDYLLVSEDGGSSFSEAFSLDADMLGFALSPDGAHLAVGGPMAGLFLADSKTLSFTQSPSGLLGPTCLKWTESDGLIACGRESIDQFTLARSDDGQQFSALYHLGALQPLSCDQGSSVGSQCASVWPGVAHTLGIDLGSASAGSTGTVRAQGGGCALSAGRASGARWLAVAGLLSCAIAARRRRRALESRSSRPTARVCGGGHRVRVRSQVVRAHARDR